MEKGVELKRQGPIIIVKEKPSPLLLPRKERVFNARCSKCGKWYEYRVGNLSVDEIRDEETDDRARALSLYKSYRERGIGPCCMKDEDRVFIARHAGSAFYHRRD